MKNEKDFTFAPSDINEIKTVITDDDFRLVNRADFKLDQKFETKPTTFLKDSLKRFSKNKSSVVAAWILATLILGAIFIPIIDQSDISGLSHRVQYEKYLEPRLFNAGTGFWDGTRKYQNIPAYYDSELPNEKYAVKAIHDLKLVDVTIENSYSPLNKYGYFWFNYRKAGLADTSFLRSPAMAYINIPSNMGAYGVKPTYKKVDLSTDYTNNITFEFATFDSIKANEQVESLIEETSYHLAPYSIDFCYTEEGQSKSVEIKALSNDYTTYTINLTSILNEKLPSITTFKDAAIQINMDTSNHETDPCLLIKSIVFEASGSGISETYQEAFSNASFTDANEAVGTRTKQVKKFGYELTNPQYWSSDGNKNIYHALLKRVSFTYDVYEEHYGLRRINDFQSADLTKYRDKGWCDFNDNNVKDTFVILDAKRCPIKEIYGQTEPSFTGTYTVDAEVYVYRFLGYSSYPRFLLGTDDKGRDMVKYVFSGLRTSLVLGTVTSAVCFLFGLAWGAISGYFGGNIDLAMERFTDILGGLPSIVIITLAIQHLGSNFFVFVMALCMTGWIGTASLTRTQFYRFKGREYILASRTLGASDFRLIFKHILPNAMGTIITSAVLMIPGVIFSEATIFYLGIVDLKAMGLDSLGVILSANQSHLTDFPYLLIFPSIIIALLEISFNLFGNGLRDAVNPTLKGEDEQ